MKPPSMMATTGASRLEVCVLAILLDACGFDVADGLALVACLTTKAPRRTMCLTKRRGTSFLSVMLATCAGQKQEATRPFSLR